MAHDPERFTKRIKGFRTIAFNLAMPVLAVWGMVSGTPAPIGTEIINQGLGLTEGLILGGWSLGNLVLRAITDTRIGKSS